MLQPVETNKAMTPLEWGMLAFLSLLWGGSFFFTAIAVRELPTLTIVVCRVGLATLILFAFMRLKGLKMPRSRSVWGTFIAMGILNNVIPFSLIVWGQSHIASGVASILNATTPLFTVVVAHFLTSDEKMSSRRLFGVFIGLFGVIAMMGWSGLTMIDPGLFAQLAIIAAAISYAFAGVFGRRFKEMGIAPIAASTLLLAPLAFYVDKPWTLAVPGVETLLALLGIAALSTALAYIFYFKLLASAGATNLLLVTFLIPSVLFYSEYPYSVKAYCQSI